MDLPHGVVEVKKVVALLVVRGDRSELSRDDGDASVMLVAVDFVVKEDGPELIKDGRDEGVIAIDGDAMQLVEETLADVVGKTVMEDFTVRRPEDENEVLFVENAEVLASREVDNVVMLDASLALRSG